MWLRGDRTRWPISSKKGAFEGRKPNPLFDPAYYLQTYPNVAASGANPLEHYIEHGAAHGYRPNPLFDSAYYLLHYRSRLQAGIRWHISSVPVLLRGCNPNPLFDTRWYMEQYPGRSDFGLKSTGPFSGAWRGHGIQAESTV